MPDITADEFATRTRHTRKSIDGQMRAEVCLTIPERDHIIACLREHEDAQMRRRTGCRCRCKCNYSTAAKAAVEREVGNG